MGRKLVPQARAPKEMIDVDLYTTAWDTSFSKKPLRTNPPHWGDISNRAPAGRLERWIWRKRLWFESTFILIVLEPWEKLLVCTVFALLAVFFTWSVYYYFPAQLQFMNTRAKYYILGDEGTQPEALTFILRQATAYRK
ncbi:hypothetical protein M407DRAFT_242792 [Tulasnella calospora MUT 4182]|uniref:Uncharacterized protein n=1 Tax=Tulasnella calospora MUT 4182 TaxID=1051891 RepID=A0A0C3M5Q6_9AGAM|nr:hypothetical protein M407DRAFT_242792 [Tulasnella calospora MUT 4182]